MRKALWMSLIGLCLICAVPVFAADKKEIVNELYVKSGLDKQLSTFAIGAKNGFDNEQRKSSHPLAAEDQVKVHQIMAEGWSEQNLSVLMKDYILGHLNENSTKAVLSWLNSPLGLKITKAEEAASNPENQETLKTYIASLNTQPPSSERLVLMNRLVAASNGVEFFYNVYATQCKSSHEAVISIVF